VKNKEWIVEVCWFLERLRDQLYITGDEVVRRDAGDLLRRRPTARS